MEAEEIKIQLRRSVKLSKPLYFMGTTAYHILGEISNHNYELFIAVAQTESYWVGCWVTGFGFIDVLFPKLSSRKLTTNEVEYYSNIEYRLPDGTIMKLKNLK